MWRPTTACKKGWGGRGGGAAMLPLLAAAAIPSAPDAVSYPSSSFGRLLQTSRVPPGKVPCTPHNPIDYNFETCKQWCGNNPGPRAE